MNANRRAKINELLHKCQPVFALQHKPWTTERQYLNFIRRYLEFTYSQPATHTSEQKFTAWLTDLAVNRQVAAATQNSGFNAVVWFYKHVVGRELKDVDAIRAQRPATVRTALPVQDVLRLLDDVRDVAHYPTRLLVRILYSCGLRLSEAISLRVKDIGFERGEITIRGGKGGKDRVVALPEDLVQPLQRQILFARATFERDVQAKVPIQIDGGLPRKYPEYRFAWHWAWVFPQHRPCRHPRTDETVRWHVLPGMVQRAIRESRRRLGLNPQLTPHVLRHSFATHLLDFGVNMKALQEQMGHSDIRTTSGYCHAEAKSVPDPVARARMMMSPPAARRVCVVTAAPAAVERRGRIYQLAAPAASI